MRRIGAVRDGAAPAPGPRDHGGGIDAARARWGGTRAEWLDLSTGINPVPWPEPPDGAPAVRETDAPHDAARRIPRDSWTSLPDGEAAGRLVRAARTAWAVPEGAAVLATPGTSAAIALLPRLVAPGRVAIPGPTYNEHAAAFAAAGWAVSATRGRTAPDAFVSVHPNNPDGRLWHADELPATRLTVIDESFADLVPDASLVALAARPGVVVLRSFGKFWGLAGLRLGFAIGDPGLLRALAEALGPWPVSGPALAIGAEALADRGWAERTRARLARDARRLDALLARHGAEPAGGTDLFRLVRTADAAALRDRLAARRVLVRTFPWSRRMVRVGLPAPASWARLEAALEAR